MPTGYVNGVPRTPPSRKGSVTSEETKRKLSEASRGKRHTDEAKKKIGDSHRGEKSSCWKGANVKYSGLHIWVRKNLGTPRHCSYCQNTNAKKYEWANKSHSYMRDLSDWIRLCTKCHIAYDKGRIKI